MSVQENGLADSGKYIDTLDADDPEYQRQMMRPIEVKEDVRQMEERKRVKLVLHSRAFRDELEELVIEQLNPGSGLQPGLSAAQLLDMLPQHARMVHSKRGVGPCIPIADVRELDVMDYSKGEKQFRCRLASLYRLVDLFGWSHGIQSYITGRINQDFEHFLIAPYGMLHHEVTASSLVKVDMRGDILDPGSTSLGVNKTGFSLHSAIYASRPDIKCVAHLRCTPAVSVSALKVGLLPLCPETMVVGDISYFEYNGGLLDLEQRDKLRRAIGPNNKVFVLRNFGIIVGGETIEEAFYLARNVMSGVDAQLRLVASDLSKLVLPSEEERRRAYDTAYQMTASSGAGEEDRRWRRGEQDFEALMKSLDNYGYRTGYLYREHVEKKLEKAGRTNSEVIVPPASTSFVYTIDPDATRALSPSGARSTGKTDTRGGDWINRGAGLEETNVLDTTKASKWAPEDTSTPIKPDSSSGQRKEHRQNKEKVFEASMTESIVRGGEQPIAQVKASSVNAEYRAEPAAKQPSSPQKSSPNTDVLHDRESSPESRGQQSGRETPGSSSTKEKKKKKTWSFGSKKKDKQ